MSKERVSREVKMERMEQKWLYNRSGVDERPAQTVRQPTVLFDEGQMQRVVGSKGVNYAHTLKVQG